MSWTPGGGWYEDGDLDDAQPPYVDITQVGLSNVAQPHWRLRLAIVPPKAVELDPLMTVVSYGLTYDRDDNGTADYVVGISNEAPKAGDFRVWVSDLETGEIREQVGPPYGSPIEFAHPDELAEHNLPELVFTFLPGSRRGGVDHKTMFYAWASVFERGEVVAWDYAPDFGWLSTSRETSALREGSATFSATGRVAHVDADKVTIGHRTDDPCKVGRGTDRAALHEDIRLLDADRADWCGSDWWLAEGTDSHQTQPRRLTVVIKA